MPHSNLGWVIGCHGDITLGCERRTLLGGGRGSEIEFLSVFHIFPVAVRSKRRVRDGSLAGIAASNPARDMDVCLCFSIVCFPCHGLIPRPEECY
jgi:hypothetical protein